LPRASRVAILRLRSLGDCVLTTPALDILKRARPDLRLAVVVEDRFRAIFEGNPDLDEILSPGLGALRRWRPRLCLNLHGGSRSAWMTAFSGARYRAGFSHFRHQFVYNVRIPRAQEILGVERKVHTAEHVASAIFYLGAPITEIPRAKLVPTPPLPDGRGSDTRATEPRPSEAVKELSYAGGTACATTTSPASSEVGQAVPPASPACGRFFHGFSGSGRSGSYAIIHPFATAPAKTWRADGFLAVAEHLQQSGLPPVFIGGSADDFSPFRAFRTISGAPLAEIKSLLSGASLFAGNDSGPAHMAAALGVPSVVIFGASDPAIWGPWRTVSEVVAAPGGIARVETAQVLEALTRLRVHA
jgi:ADP-heptose:LPS heptosyltransferase